MDIFVEISWKIYVEISSVEIVILNKEILNQEPLVCQASLLQWSNGFKAS